MHTTNTTAHLSWARKAAAEAESRRRQRRQACELGQADPRLRDVANGASREMMGADILSPNSRQQTQQAAAVSSRQRAPGSENEGVENAHEGINGAITWCK
jgi:hypothetical protein